MLAGLISGTSPGSNLCRGMKLGQANPGTYAIVLNFLSSQLSPGSINLVPSQAGKVTVGLASQTIVVLPPMGSQP